MYQYFFPAIFLLVSVIIDQTCSTIYDLDTNTINNIVRNLNESSDGSDLIPFDVEFKVFSNMIFECATNSSDDISLWGVLEQKQFNGLMNTTCNALSQYIEDVPLDCNNVNNRDDLLYSFIDSLNITDTVLEEYRNFNVSEMYV